MLQLEDKKSRSAEGLEPFSIRIEGSILAYLNQYRDAMHLIGVSDEMVGAPGYEELYESMMSKAALFSNALNSKILVEYEKV